MLEERNSILESDNFQSIFTSRGDSALQFFNGPLKRNFIKCNFSTTYPNISATFYIIELLNFSHLLSFRSHLREAWIFPISNPKLNFIINAFMYERAYKDDIIGYYLADKSNGIHPLDQHIYRGRMAMIHIYYTKWMAISEIALNKMVIMCLQEMKTFNLTVSNFESSKNVFIAFHIFNIHSKAALKLDTYSFKLCWHSGPVKPAGHSHLKGNVEFAFLLMFSQCGSGLREAIVCIMSFQNGYLILDKSEKKLKIVWRMFG